MPARAPPLGGRLTAAPGGLWNPGLGQTVPSGWMRTWSLPRRRGSGSRNVLDVGIGRLALAMDDASVLWGWGGGVGGRGGGVGVSRGRFGGAACPFMVYFTLLYFCEALRNRSTRGKKPHDERSHPLPYRTAQTRPTRRRDNVSCAVSGGCRSIHYRITLRSCTLRSVEVSHPVGCPRPVTTPPMVLKK